MGAFFLTKEARIYNGAKTASSTNGAGNTGQLHVKEWIATLPNSKHNNKLEAWILCMRQEGWRPSLGTRGAALDGLFRALFEVSSQIGQRVGQHKPAVPTQPEHRAGSGRADLTSSVITGSTGTAVKV